MDPYFLKTVFTIMLIIGAIATAAGTIGTVVYNLKVAKLAPYKEPVMSATATILMTIETDRPREITHMMKGAYISFKKNEEIFFEQTATEYSTHLLDNNQMAYFTNLNANLAQPFIGQPIESIGEDGRRKYSHIRSEK